MRDDEFYVAPAGPSASADVDNGCGVLVVLLGAVWIMIILGLVGLGWWLRGVCA